jgi:hypothetical protein
VPYGPVIDWHLDGVHSKSSPRKPWFRINYFDSNQVGDPKITWELNRHQHLVVLAKAFRLTGDRRFTQELFAQWYSWQEQNPSPIGINWASSLEVAFRSLSWTWIWFLLQGTDVVPPDFASDWLHAQEIAGRHIERYLSTYTSPNTHLLGEAVGLFFIGTACPQLPRASHWQNMGWQIVLGEAKNQVRADGFHFEQSTYYHVYALDLFLHARMLAARNNVAVPGWFDQALQRMMSALALLGRTGAAPSFSDDDGGRVFDSSRNGRKHLLDPLAIGAALFDNAEFKTVAGNLTEEALWLLGPAVAGQFDAMAAAPGPASSAALTGCGGYVMANHRGAQLVMDAGPQGTHTAGHGHADALSIHVSANGQELLTDPGTCEYGGDGLNRRWFRSTAAHNTVQIDGLDQAEIKGPFSWASLPITKVERWIAGEQFDVFCGSHNGYERLPGAVNHQRWVINFKAGFWLVRDVILGRGCHSIDVAWHLSPNLSQHGPIYLAENEQAGLAILSADGESSADVCDENWSPCYGQKIAAKTLHQRYRAELPLEVVNLLVPTNSAGELGSFRRSDIGEVSAYEYRSRDAEHVVVCSPRPQPWSVAGWSSDADLLCCTTRNGQVEALLFCNGTFLERHGETLVSARQRVTWCELRRNGATFEVSSPEYDAIQLRAGAEAAEATVPPQPERMGI